MVTAAPETRQHAGLGIGEHGRAVDDARPGGIVDRDLDDVDAEQRRAVVARHLVDAPGELLLVSDGLGAGVVDDDPAVVTRARND